MIQVSNLTIHRWDVETGGWSDTKRITTALSVELSLALAVSPADVSGVQRPLTFRRATGPGPGVYRVIDETAGTFSFWKLKMIRR